MVLAMFNDCCSLCNRVAFRCEEYRNVVSFKSSALYANILCVYIRAELINHSHPRKKRTKKIYVRERRKYEEPISFH